MLYSYFIWRQIHHRIAVINLTCKRFYSQWPLQKCCVIKKLQQNLLFLVRKFVSRQCSDSLSNLSNYAYCSLTIIIIIIIIIKGEFNLLNVQFSFFTLNLQKISNFSAGLTPEGYSSTKQFNQFFFNQCFVFFDTCVVLVLSLAISKLQ